MDNVKVGDEVISIPISGFGTKRIGTVVHITNKRKDITVDFGNYQEKYDSYGYQKNDDVWHKHYLELYEKEQGI